jgi:hypothetical protein
MLKATNIFDIDRIATVVKDKPSGNAMQGEAQQIGHIAFTLPLTNRPSPFAERQYS